MGVLVDPRTIMTYIAPNGTVQFFSDIGLSPNYSDSLYFATASARDAYFDKLTKIATVGGMSYVNSAKHQGELRVELNMTSMVNAGYMRFRNTAFEGRWWYAFVTNVEYLGNATTIVHFEMDVLMSHMGIFKLADCYIERQHTISDAIGANIADEGLDTGPYITEGSSTTALFGQYYIVIFQSEDLEGQVEGILYGGIFSGAHMYIATSAASANSYLNSLVSANKADIVLMIYMLPYYFVEAQQAGSDRPTNATFSVTKPYTTIAGYTPRNKKLFCYPYKELIVYNCEGGSNEYKYEYFNTLPDDASGGECFFSIRGIVGLQSEITCIPQEYNGEAANYSERLSMTKFPKCSWNVDAYKAYIAQSESNMPGSILGSIAGAAISGVTGNPIGVGVAAGNLLQTVTADLGVRVTHPVMPPTAKGEASSDVLSAMGVKNFYFLRKSITKNYAMMIDSYFDMFGYAIKQHGVPNMNARPNWTYVKTRGCVVHGNLPAEHGAKIESIFDSGIRFWKDHNNIGNYSLDNSPGGN